MLETQQDKVTVYFTETNIFVRLNSVIHSGILKHDNLAHNAKLH